jgi:hypothetical protein
MNRSSGTSFADAELVDLFADEPELLAIADAIRTTAPAGADRGPAPGIPARRTLRPSLVAAAVLIAAAAAIVLVAPWQRSHGTLADEALAAIGTGPVMHVISGTPTGAGLVDLRTGTTRPLEERDEIWYDASRGLRRDLSTIGSTIVGDELDTPHGGYVPGGIVYDCTWIAAHPIAATKARVSCNASGKNGKKPHVVPRPKPTLDPGLAGFADGYQAALASGQAREAGTGIWHGRKVDWLVFRTSDGGSERVGLDPASHKPLAIRSQKWTERIVDIETIPYDSSDFARPRPAELSGRPGGGRTEDISAIALNGHAIAAALPESVWPGARVAGLSLSEASTEKLTARSFKGATRTGFGLDLIYGRLTGNGRLNFSQPNVEIQEAPSWSLLPMRAFVRSGKPPAGTLYLDPLPGARLTSDTLSIGARKAGGVYVVIQTNMTPSTVIKVARALTRIAPGP